MSWPTASAPTDNVVVLFNPIHGLTPIQSWGLSPAARPNSASFRFPGRCDITCREINLSTIQQFYNRVPISDGLRYGLCRPRSIGAG
jgi:hypothetical protein